MSVAKEQKQAKRGRKPTSGGRLSNALRGSGRGKVSWASCDPEATASLIEGVTDAGGAVMFGASRDGMALSVTLHLDGDRETIWIDRDKDVSEQLSALIDTLRDTLL